MGSAAGLELVCELPGCGRSFTDAGEFIRHRKKCPAALDTPTEGRTSGPSASRNGKTIDVRLIALDQIDRNPEQPRREFDPVELESLARSIQEHGVLQPIVVRRAGRRFQLVAGDRRVQAAHIAGLAQIFAVVSDDERHSALELALVENLVRRDLTPLEEAAAYRTLIEHGLTTGQVARRVGRDSSTVSNSVRLLSAPVPLQRALAGGRISEGHVRALLPLQPGQVEAALKEVTSRGLSVRETEALARERTAKPRPQPPDEDDPRSGLAQELGQALGATVRIVRRGRGGDIAIAFASAHELDRLAVALFACARGGVGETGAETAADR